MAASSEENDDDDGTKERDDWKRVLWKGCVYVVTAGMVVAMLAGLDMSWSAICAALILVAIDFKDAQPCLDKVSYSKLVFFSGMFMAVEGLDETGIPEAFWEMMELYAQIDSVAGLVVLSLVIIILCSLFLKSPLCCCWGVR